MSRTFPRAFSRGCFLFVCCCSLVIFPYAGHDVHRRGHGRRRPLRGLSVAFRGASRARRRGGADRSLRRSAAATRLGVARGMDSNIGQVTGLASVAPSGLLLPHQNAIAATSAISAGRARPGAARAPRPALIPKQYKARRRKAERSLKPPPTLPTRLALGLALLGLLPSPEVVIPIILVRRRRAPVRSVVALVEAPAAALALREVLGPRLLATVADLCARSPRVDRRHNAPCASPSCRSGSGRSASCLPGGVLLYVSPARTCGRRCGCGCGSSFGGGRAPRSGRAAAAAGSGAPRRPLVAARAASAARRVAARRSGGTPCVWQN